MLVTANGVPSSTILVTLIKEAIGSSETPVLTRATQPNIPENSNLHSHRRENLKSYTTSGCLSASFSNIKFSLTRLLSIKFNF
jgi:hypothetical protein